MATKKSPQTKPAYFIASYNIADEAAFKAYQKKALPMLKKYKCEVITLGNKIVDDIVELTQCQMTVVLKFPSATIAQQWYRSQEYQAIIKERWNSTSDNRACIVEGI